jgi:secondary thiamine-phosphate synthase enzyme
MFFQQLVPEDGANYLHRSEGPDDMPAHIRSALTQTQISIPVNSGNPSLGTWQDIYLFEHRRQPHMRKIHLHLIGE